jgi:hypothetical protein
MDAIKKLPSSRNDAEIIQIMTDHMASFLEKPHPAFGNLPICPYARKARLDNKILFKVERIGFTHHDSTINPQVLDHIKAFQTKGSFEVMVMIHPDVVEMPTLEEIEGFVKVLNGLIQSEGLVCFSGHPDNDFNIQGTFTRRDPFVNITIQKKTHLDQAAKQLKKTPYYDQWTSEDLAYIHG